MKKYILMALGLCGLIGCGENSVVIDGQFFGENEKNIFLEKLSPNGGQIVDSVKTDKNGKFTFTIKDKLNVPTFYNVNLGNSYVPLLVEDGEDIEVSSVGNIFYNYTVEGSKGSALIKEFNSIVRNSSLKMDSLFNLYENSVDFDRAQQLGVEYEKAYIQFKRDAIVFISKNSHSMASLLPLYKPFNTDGQFLFDQPSDYLYFVMLSDSLSMKYPTSEYVISLQKDIDALQTRKENASKVDSMISVAEQKKINYIDLKMVDAKGTKATLSDNGGKIILLSFTASEPVELKALNNELKAIYKRHAGEFVVYQVFLDVNKALWLNTVSSQGLPWICVNDFGGANSVAAKLYNIKQLPTNILINANGEIVNSNLPINRLEAELEKLK